MSLARRAKMIETRTHSGLSQTNDDSSRSLKQPATCDRMVCRPPRALVLITLLALLAMALLGYSGEAFAQGTNDEDFVKQVVSNVNAYWDKEFRLLGVSYTPVKLKFVYDESVDTVCGPFSTADGPAYCVGDETLYYPVHFLEDGRTLASYGASAVEWAIAHEIGHNAQVQMDKLGIQRLDAIPLKLVELQADCFSGMYASQAITRPEDIEAALAAMQDAGGPDHGSSRQRIAAYDLGYQTGDLSRCLALTSGDATTDGR